MGRARGGRPTGADEAESYPHEPRPPSRDVDHVRPPGFVPHLHLTPSEIRPGLPPRGAPPSSPACVAAAAAAPRPALTTSSTKALGNARRRRLVTAARGDEIDPNAAAREAEGRLERTWPNSPRNASDLAPPRARLRRMTAMTPMILLCSDGVHIPCPAALAADARILSLASSCSDADVAPVPLPFRSSLVSAAGVALSHPSPAAAALAPGAYPDPRAAASALVFLAELAILADYLDARRLELACAALASSASELAIKSAWAKASVRPPPAPRKRPFQAIGSS
eukprot:tig00000411_g512.t1